MSLYLYNFKAGIVSRCTIENFYQRRLAPEINAMSIIQNTFRYKGGDFKLSFFVTVTCPFIIFDKVWWKKYFVSNFKGSKKWTHEYFKIVTNVGAFE